MPKTPPRTSLQIIRAARKATAQANNKYGMLEMHQRGKVAISQALTDIAVNGLNEEKMLNVKYACRNRPHLAKLFWSELTRMRDRGELKFLDEPARHLSEYLPILERYGAAKIETHQKKYPLNKIRKKFRARKKP